MKRFRKEVREREDIVPFATVTLTSDPKRKANALAAELLLKEIFDDRITIRYAKDGLVCGSREEAGANRLLEYTAKESKNKSQETARKDVLLSSLTINEIETYLEEQTSTQHTVFVPDTPEVRLLRQLGDEFPDVLYGI